MTARCEHCSACRFYVIAAVVGGLLAVGCEESAVERGDGGESAPGAHHDWFRYAIIEISPNNLIEVPSSAIPGTESEHIVRITNLGDSTLALREIVLSSAAVEGDTAPAFRLERVRGLCTSSGGCVPAMWSPGAEALPVIGVRRSEQGAETEGFDAVEVVVVFRSPGGADTRAAQLTITSNADGATTRVVAFLSHPSTARLVMVPPEITFGHVGAGEAAEAVIQLSNVGVDDLLIDRFALTGGADFAVAVDHDRDPGTDALALGVGGAYMLIPPLRLEWGQARAIRVLFTPSSDSPAAALLRVDSNDPTQPDGAEVPLWGNPPAPCLAAEPATLNFGAKGIDLLATLPVELQSCGAVPVAITSIALDPERSDDDFALDLTPLGDAAPSAEAPLVIPPGEMAAFTVRYAPSEGAGCWWRALTDTAVILVHSEGSPEPLEIAVRGMGVDISCPQAVIGVEEGTTVTPGTTLHLSSEQSFSPSGPAAAWEWTVEQPAGSQSLFDPTATTPSPTFTAQVVGTYLFKLSVWDLCGTPTCIHGEAEVVVATDDTLRIELLWDTPYDPDQTDEGPTAGADLDLHLLRTLAGEGDAGWFKLAVDCWASGFPCDWGVFNFAGDDPALARVDDDGAGPEVLVFDAPERGASYRIGVHYPQSNGYGPSYATVRVYVHGDLAFEVTDVKLLPQDLWEVGTLDWPSGAVTPRPGPSGGLRIVPEIEEPQIFWP